MDKTRKLSELTVNELVEIANQKFIPSLAGDCSPGTLVLEINGNLIQTLSAMSEAFKKYIKEKFGVDSDNNSFDSNFERVSEPIIGKVYFRVSKDEKTLIPCKIIDGALFRNGRLSNVWDWENLLTGEKEYGYGGFFKLKEG